MPLPASSLAQTCDVLVVGGGNAAMCAAISAAEGGASVIVLEAAPHPYRGGNSRHTRDIRYLHPGATRYVTGPYDEAEFWDDLWRVTGGETDEILARLVIQRSVDIEAWMMAHGVRWQPPLHGTLHLARTNVFMLGGGKAMMNALYQTAESLGVSVRYESRATSLSFDGHTFCSARVSVGQEQHHIDITARSLVVAAGGFEANVPWLKRYWGDAADNFIIRGTPYNRGDMLAALLDAGALAVGDPKEFHAVALDARAPKFDGGIVTRLDSVPFGIVVNRDAQRFYDEGEDFWPKRYAIWGGLIARQPEQIAYSIIDSRSMGLFMPSVFPPIKAASLAALASALGLDPERLCRTVAAYNTSVQPGQFDPGALDECRTEGLQPPKSHWAVTIESPPFYGYPLKTGVTFTYRGVAVDEQARVIFGDRGPAPNVFAAGEVMAGNILGRGYLAGFGLTIGTVFGRIAGKEAAAHATH
ncbi:MAG TPA: FAD-dependent tricarballylate dehydrogenase TcuA [Chloroflexota bacterium]